MLDVGDALAPARAHLLRPVLELRDGHRDEARAARVREQDASHELVEVRVELVQRLRDEVQRARRRQLEVGARHAGAGASGVVKAVVRPRIRYNLSEYLRCAPAPRASNISEDTK